MLISLKRQIAIIIDGGKIAVCTLCPAAARRGCISGPCLMALPCSGHGLLLIHGRFPGCRGKYRLCCCLRSTRGCIRRSALPPARRGRHKADLPGHHLYRRAVVAGFILILPGLQAMGLPFWKYFAANSALCRQATQSIKSA